MYSKCRCRGPGEDPADKDRWLSRRRRRLLFFLFFLFFTHAVNFILYNAVRRASSKFR